MKTRPMGAEQFHVRQTDGETWRNRLSLFSIFSKELNYKYRVM
jgi:hypothetical protein